MTKQETYEAGLKLIGIYFIVSGISILAMVIVDLFKYAYLAIDARIFKTILQSLLHPGVQIILGAILINKANSIADLLNGQKTANQPSEVVRQR